MKPVAYEGTEPYIFVSYAHRDSERVFEVLNELQDRSYRFWYDDGIAPGSEWPEDIAQHLDGAAMVMAFVTPNSMKSQNCRREINFSLSREKPFLSVLLEETEMPLGMQMQLSAQQSILRYNYDSWQAFINKILACPDIVPCLKEPEPEPVPAAPVATVPEPAPAPAPVTPVAAPTAEEPVAESVSPSSERVAAGEGEVAATQVQPKAKKGIFASKPAKKAADAVDDEEPPVHVIGEPAVNRLPLIGVIAAALVVGIAALFFFLRGGQIETSWGETIKKSQTTVNVSKQTLEQSDLESIAAMTDLQTLDLSNCDLSACDFSSASFASTQLSEINLASSTGVKDYSFLEGLALKSLNVEGCADFDDAALARIDTQNLRTLVVSGTAVTDLSVLAANGGDGADLPLGTLAFADTKVKDIEILGQMQNLTSVDGSRSGVTSLDALAPLAKLRVLRFDGCTIGKVAKTFASLELKSLSLSGAGITDLSGFSDCTVLGEINFSDNPKLASMDWLDPQNYDTLTSLDLSRTGFDTKGLSWIAQCSKLTDVALDGVALADLSCVDGLKDLRTISAINCGLEDISGLSKASKLERILLSSNKIESVAALSGLSLEKRVTLDLTNNALKSVAELPVGEYRAIMLYGNDASVAATLPEGIKAFEVSTAYFDELPATSLADVTNDLYVVGCPQKQVVKMQEAFGSSRLNLVSEDELWELYAADDFAYDLGDMSYLVSVVTGSEFSGESSANSGGSTGMPSISETVAYDEDVSFTI